MPGSFRIGKVFGIDLSIHFTWLIAFLLITWSLGSDGFEVILGDENDWSTGVLWFTSAAAAILLFVSVLIHEYAHSFVAIAKGIPVHSITLFIFGGVSNISGEAENARDEFQISAVGPASSLVLAAVFGALFLIEVAGSGTPLHAILGYLTLVNFLVGVFNMLPGFPLDGGRVLRSIVWGATKDAHRATQVATRVGEAFGWGLIILGALLALTTGELFSGLWMALIGWFLKDAASGTREQATAQNIFADTLVRDVMSPVHESVPVNTSVGDLVAEYFLPRGLRALPVTSAGRIAGIVTLSDVKELPQDQWDSTPVARIMTSDPLRYVEQDAHFSEAISMMQEHDLNQVLVLDGDQAVGMVNRTDVIRYMQVRKELGGRARGQDRSPYRPGE